MYASPLHSSPPCFSFSISSPDSPQQALRALLWMVVSGVAQGHRRRPVMTGKGSEIITQGHRCSVGVECLLFGPCCQSRFSKRKWGEIAKLKGWSNCGLLQRPLASQPSPSPSSFNPHPLFRVQSLGLLPGKPAGHFFTHLKNNSPSWFPAFSRRGLRDVGRPGGLAARLRRLPLLPQPPASCRVGL